MDLKEKISKLHLLLNEAINQIDTIKNGKNGLKLNNLVNISYKITLIRNELLKKYKREELQKFDKELFEKAKLFKEKLDNMIEEYNSQSVEISKKLMQIGNQKKLANYFR